MELRPLTLADFPRTGRMVLVYGSLSAWSGPGRWDCALWKVDADGQPVWFGGRFSCAAGVGNPAVTHWAELPSHPAAETTEAKA